MKTFILLGAPGTGKGTVARGLQKLAPFIHVSTGKILREEVKKGTVLGKKVESFMQDGELVPDNIMGDVIEGWFSRGREEAFYMFDGFPRTEAQAMYLSISLVKFGINLERVFYLEASRRTLIRRLTGRRVCRNCEANYHVTDRISKKENICDVCGGKLYQRVDDMMDTIVKRLEIFYMSAEILIPYYENRGILIRLDSDVDTNILATKIIKNLEIKNDRY